MKTLTIFYDPACGLCARFRRWLEAQRKRVAVEFIDFRSQPAQARFPGLSELHPERDVVVLADDGRWWQGPAAWLTCLWVTVDYRAWSFRLAAPVLLPLVRQAVHLLSENRLTLSRLMALRTDAELAGALDRTAGKACADGTCAI